VPQDDHGQEPDSSQGPDAPKNVTEEQLNKAISARLAAFEKKHKEQLAAALETLAPTLDQLLEQKLAGIKAPEPAAPKGKTEVENDPLFKGMQKRLAELEATANEARAQAAAQAKAAKDSLLRQKAAEELSKHGIDAARARHALATLVDSDKRVRWSEDDDSQLVFRDSDGTEVDLTTGIRSWVKTDEAKIFLPPRGTAGSGERPQGKQPITNQKGGVSREGLGQAILNEYLKGSI